MSNDETIARLYAAADKGDVADFFRQYAAYLETQHILSPLRKRLRAMSRRAEAMAAQVERLRITEVERDAIGDCADAAEAYMNDDIAATLRALNDRHARETAGGDSPATVDTGETT